MKEEVSWFTQAMQKKADGKSETKEEILKDLKERVDDDDDDPPVNTKGFV